MKKRFSLLVLALGIAASCLLSGCIVINVEKTSKPKPGTEAGADEACEHCAAKES